jgi:hypothetical protein
MKKIITFVIIVATLMAIYFLCLNPVNHSKEDANPIWDSTFTEHSKIPDSI